MPDAKIENPITYINNGLKWEQITLTSDCSTGEDCFNAIMAGRTNPTIARNTNPTPSFNKRELVSAIFVSTDTSADDGKVGAFSRAQPDNKQVWASYTNRYSIFLPVGSVLEVANSVF